MTKKKPAKSTAKVSVQKQMRLLGYALYQSLPMRGRPPGEKCLEVLAEIFTAHTSGQLWYPRGEAGAHDLTVIAHRSASALRLRDVYLLVKGSGTQGYTLMKCPACAHPACYGMTCSEPPMANEQVAAHLSPVLPVAM